MICKLADAFNPLRAKAYFKNKYKKKPNYPVKYLTFYPVYIKNTFVTQLDIFCNSTIGPMQFFCFLGITT